MKPIAEKTLREFCSKIEMDVINEPLAYKRKIIAANRRGMIVVSKVKTKKEFKREIPKVLAKSLDYLMSAIAGAKGFSISEVARVQEDVSRGLEFVEIYGYWFLGRELVDILKLDELKFSEPVPIRAKCNTLTEMMVFSFSGGKGILLTAIK